MLPGRMPQLTSSLSGPLHGQFTLSIGEGSRYVELKALTSFFGIIHSLFQHMWDRPEMSGILESDETFEIVASSIKCIYDQTCRRKGWTQPHDHLPAQGWSHPEKDPGRTQQR